jgi:predicted N-formylglutamate amidohydrolase
MSVPVLSEAEERLLAAAVRTLPGADAAPLLICEHAGNLVPAPWQNLGLPAALLDSHFAWDAGAGALTELLAARLDAPAVLATYSRLFLDLNRFPGDWDCLRPDLGGIPVPANLRVTAAERDLRERIARQPFDAAVAALLPGRPAVVSIHSFTPWRDGLARPTEIGVLWREEAGLGPAVLAALRRDGRFAIGDNEPYDWRLSDGYSLRRHGLDRGLPCLYLEIRSDLLAHAAGREVIADALVPALAACTTSAVDATRQWFADLERGPSSLGANELRPENSRNPQSQGPDPGRT